MEKTETFQNSGNTGIADLESLQAMDMAVEPYPEVKKFLDKRAHETMYEIRAFINDLLSFESEKNAR